MAEEEKVAILRNIVSEMMQYFRDSNLRCEESADTYLICRQEGTPLSREKRPVRSRSGMKLFRSMMRHSSTATGVSFSASELLHRRYGEN